MTSSIESFTRKATEKVTALRSTRPKGLERAFPVQTERLVDKDNTLQLAALLANIEKPLTVAIVREI